MKANRDLIEAIDKLRTERDAKLHKFKEKGGEKTLNFYREKERQREQLLESHKATDPDQFKTEAFAGESLEVQKEMEKKREYIQQLERKLQELHQRKMHIQQFNNSGQQWQK